MGKDDFFCYGSHENNQAPVKSILMTDLVWARNRAEVPRASISQELLPFRDLKGAQDGNRHASSPAGLR